MFIFCNLRADLPRRGRLSRARYATISGDGNRVTTVMGAALGGSRHMIAFGVHNPALRKGEPIVACIYQTLSSRVHPTCRPVW
jgi:hypothetical protein